MLLDLRAVAGISERTGWHPGKAGEGKSNLLIVSMSGKLGTCCIKPIITP